LGFFSLLQRRADPVRESAADRIRSWAYVFLCLGEADSLTISQIQCNDTICPGTETIILVLRKHSKTQAVKIKKPLVEVTEQDTISALENVKFHH
jgi:hypothetical protein